MSTKGRYSLVCMCTIQRINSNLFNIKSNNSFIVHTLIECAAAAHLCYVKSKLNIKCDYKDDIQIKFGLYDYILVLAFTACFTLFSGVDWTLLISSYHIKYHWEKSRRDD